MLTLQPPQQMSTSHAFPRERSHDFYSPSRSAPRYEPPRQYEHSRQMQLPVPRITTGHELDAFRIALPPPPLSPPPTGSAVRAALPPHVEGTRPQYDYQLPAIGNSQRVTGPASRSPTPQKQPSSSQDTPRKKMAISPNMRVPSSVRCPQEGLAQLAAEVTCLFWFEDPSALKQVLDANSPHPTRPLVPDALPTTGFMKWVTTILATTQVAQNVVILALLFIYRLKKATPSVKGNPGSEYRLLTVALMLGNKFLDDNTYTNKTWAEVSGISVQEVHIMEVEFLSNMRYSLFTSKEKWDEWHILLGKFGTFYDRASKIPHTPLLHVPPQFAPSPPSQQLSPPKSVNSWSPSSRSQLTPLLHPQAQSAAVSPSGPPPELGPLTTRKRSNDYNNVEPPPKRQAHGLAPGPYSHAPLIPTLQMPAHRAVDAPSMNNRLPPPPNLTIPPPQQNPPVQVNGWPELPLPAPGSRSMAIVYPTPVQYRTPTSTMAPSYPSFSTPSAGERSGQVSPYPQSTGSSPVSATFPPSNQNTRQLSPSYFLNQRQSPYRPVVQVHQLLVPPPSTSVQNAARTVSYDHMQYQPLGKPITERRPGPLPYMDQYAWPQPHQYNQLPVPQQPVFHR